MKSGKLWRFNQREDVWSLTKIWEEKPCKEIRNLQKRFLNKEISFEEYTKLMDELK